MRENKNNAPTDEHICKILITCAMPSDSGKMEVEMSYEGDPSLASYLLESAQGFIEQDEDLSTA